MFCGILNKHNWLNIDQQKKYDTKPIDLFHHNLYHELAKGVYMMPNRSGFGLRGEKILR